jgi:molybdate transport system substrate-binding protein
MKKVGWLIFLLLLGCAGRSDQRIKLHVFAASSLTNAFTEIGSLFEDSHPSVDVHFNFAGSQVLRAQVLEGAQVDLLALADRDEMQILELRDDVVKAGTVKDFASNRMVLVLPPGNPMAMDNPRDLATPGIKLVLAAEQVPAGKYARAVLMSLDQVYGPGYSSRALANVVSNEENVRQVLGKVELGEADAGVVYASDAAAAAQLITIPFPDQVNPYISYPIAVVESSPNPALAAGFIDFLLSEEGQSLLQKWGFLPPAHG